MKLEKGQEYSVCTGTICHQMKFIGIVSNGPDSLLCFENNREGSYRYVGAVIDWYQFPHDTQVTFTIRATHYGQTIEDLVPQGMTPRKWRLE